MKKFIEVGCICAAIVLAAPGMAKESQVKQQVIKTKTAHDYYNEILNAYQNQQWKELVFNAKLLVVHYPESPFNSETHYYKGVAYYHLADFDLANDSFTKYLRHETTPKFFEEAIEYKFNIAEKFYSGARKHLLGFEKMPKIFSAKEEALDIYEEIITTLPRHDLTAQSLYKKGCLLYDYSDYKPSVEAFQTLIRRFPKHYLAPEGFIGIQRVYLKQCQEEFSDPDVLQLAEINLQKFKEAFPGEPRIEQVQGMLVQMEDEFAKDLFEIGSFYERTKKDDAALLYYTNIMANYPHSSYAQKAHKHIEKLQHKKQHQSKKKSYKKK